MSIYTDSDVDSLGFFSQQNETCLFEDGSSAEISPSSASDEDMCLEGTLLIRKGRSTGHASILWKQRFVHLSFREGGSISVYRESPFADDQNSLSASTNKSTTLLRTMYSRIQKKVALSVSTQRSTTDSVADNDMYMYIPAHLPWVAKDVEHSQATFCVEIPTADESYDPGENSEAISEADTTTSNNNMIVDAVPAVEDDEVPDDLFDEMITARKRGRPLRIYFRCSKGSPEKALWIRAFTKIGRFSNQIRQKKSLLVALASPLYMGPSRVRTRNQEGADFARATRELDIPNGELNSSATAGVCLTEHIEGKIRGKDQKRQDREYKVLPNYAYPHRWMTRDEMRREMLLPSAHFHDLRVPDTKEKEIGSLHVEVLECVGLPKLDRMSETDAVAYLVCGKYAFTTDVIANRANPMWLRYAKRACIFPVFHAYARLYVGVFDDDDHREKDDFAGRVVVNLARLRPASTYDVTLPLRLSTHAFSRRKRGAIRLRFTLHWSNERDALFTYIPRKVNIPLPQHSKPNLDVTVACGDPKAFRNIAFTVHGSHMAGRFTFPKVKAAIREMNFTRKTVINLIRQEVFDIREWKTPSVSAYVFLAWMHCIYANSFSLVPAYTVFYFVLLLMRTYAIYGIDGPSQRGFLPPSWEELFATLVMGGKSGRNGTIQPLNMVMRSRPLKESGETSGFPPMEEQVDYKVSTHVFRFKWLLGALGFLPEHDESVDLDDYHLEFPFADGKVYPKFRVRECLADKKDDKDNETSWHGSASENITDSLRMTRDNNGEIRLIPRFDLDFDIMRKDSSGLRDYDDEEKNFATRHALRGTAKKTKKTIFKTANDVYEKTGINHVATGIGQVVSPIKTGVENMGHMLEWQSGHRRTRSLGSASDTVSSTGPGEQYHMDSLGELVPAHSFDVKQVLSNDQTEHSEPSCVATSESMSKDNSETPATWPDQDLDQNGPTTNKKLTDDLNENKDKMHELTWHLFDDKVYTIKEDRETCFFGDAKKPEKRRKPNIPKQLNKLLQVDQYSHSNPFVARLGLYVEPIVESALSFLCMFRALFNALTWQDPMLTFLISVFLTLLAAVLFIFPWRIFLFLVGGFLVGPQNYLIRKLRESGHLPPKKKPTRHHKHREVEEGPVAYSHVGLHGILGPRPRPEADPREVQHVVVPYGPLMYQRFYDWPPEPQYAQVRAEDPSHKPSKPCHIRNKSGSFGSTNSRQTAWRNVRRRFHRHSNSMDIGVASRGSRGRAASGDCQSLPGFGSVSPKKER